eukprot:480797-Prorocentrum_lima.AAC.1
MKQKGPTARFSRAGSRRRTVKGADPSFSLVRSCVFAWRWMPSSGFPETSSSWLPDWGSAKLVAM